MENKQIITKDELMKMIKEYITMGIEMQNTSIEYSTLRLFKNKNDFIFNYTIAIDHNHLIDDRVILSKCAIKNIINYYYSDMGYNVLDYSIIDEENCNIELIVKKVNSKVKSFGGK